VRVIRISIARSSRFLMEKAKTMDREQHVLCKIPWLTDLGAR
jgi:hypothetical protein